MKASTKSIGLLALLASSTAAHAIAPRIPTPLHKACIDIDSDESGAVYAGSCDQTRNNAKLNKPLNRQTGCAEGQARFTSRSVEIPACMPVGMVQL